MVMVLIILSTREINTLLISQPQSRSCFAFNVVVALVVDALATEQQAGDHVGAATVTSRPSIMVMVKVVIVTVLSRLWWLVGVMRQLAKVR